MATPIRTPETVGIYGAPPGLEAEVGGLPYWRVREIRSRGYEVPVIYSVWTLSDEERSIIAAGGELVLGIVGEPIPPVSIAVRPGAAERELAEATR